MWWSWAQGWPACPPRGTWPAAGRTSWSSRRATGPAGGWSRPTLADGRLVQLGGEVVGPVPHGLLRTGRGARADAGPFVPAAAGRGHPGHRRTAAHRRVRLHERRGPGQLRRGERGFRQLAATVDPDDPWSHPDAERLDRSPSASGCARSAPHPTRSARATVSMLALSAESVERTSLLSDLRKEAAADDRASMTTRSGSASGSPRARPRSPCGWRRSSATASATARR